MFDVDSETLFNAAGAAVTTIAVGIFTLNVELGYSPVSKLLVVGCFLTGIFALTQRTSEQQLTLLGYGVIVVSAVVLFFETVNTFDLGDAMTAGGLLGIGALLFLARGALDTQNRFITGQRATYTLGIVAAITIAVLLTDVITGGLAYELRVGENVTIEEERERATVGTLIATNPTPLPEDVDEPRYRACTVGNWTEYRPLDERGQRRRVDSDVHVDVDYNDHILSYSQKSYPARLHLRAVNITDETFTITKTDACPGTDTGDPSIAVFETTEHWQNIRPV